MSRKDNLLGSFGIGKSIPAEPNEAMPSPAPGKAGSKDMQGNADCALKITTIVFKGSSYQYAKLRARQLKAEGAMRNSVSDFIERLIDQDRKNNPEISLKAQKLAEIENM